MLALPPAVRRWTRGAARHRTPLAIGLALTIIDLVGLAGTSRIALVAGLLTLSYGAFETVRPVLEDRRATGHIYTEPRPAALVPSDRPSPYATWAGSRLLATRPAPRGAGR